MVEFEEVKVPQLRLDRVRAAPPVSGRRVPFDEHGASSMLTPKITGPPGSARGKPASSLQQGRVPGYSGHLSGVISDTHATGKTFGSILRMDSPETRPGSTAVSPGPYASTYRRSYAEDGPGGWREAFDPPNSARDPNLDQNWRHQLQGCKSGSASVVAWGLHADLARRGKGIDKAYPAAGAPLFNKLVKISKKRPINASK